MSGSVSYFSIIYVDNPLVSAEFYARLLGRQPVEVSPTFALFMLENGLGLGLWSRHTVEPSVARRELAASSPFPSRTGRRWMRSLLNG